MYKAKITLINKVEILQTNEIDQNFHLHPLSALVLAQTLNHL